VDQVKEAARSLTRQGELRTSRPLPRRSGDGRFADLSSSKPGARRVQLRGRPAAGTGDGAPGGRRTGKKIPDKFIGDVIRELWRTKSPYAGPAA